VAALCGVGGVPSTLHAQGTAPTPRLDSLLDRWQQPGLRVNALIRAFGDYQPDRVARGSNGFQVFEARLGIAGELDAGWRYQLQTGVTRSPALLDVRIGKRLSPTLLVDVGRFKADFGREWILAISDADFAARSAVALALAPARQMGVQARQTLAAGRVELAAGAFNGNATHTGNDDGNLLWTGRAGLWLQPPSAVHGGWELAVNAASSVDAAAPIGTLLPSYAGSRRIVGLETWRRGARVLVAGEYIRADLDSLSGTRFRPEGWQATLGWRLDADDELLLRWDVLRSDGLGAGVDDLIVGWNRWSAGAVETQVNWLIPLRQTRLDRQRLVISVQLVL
jgi:hypothetical protein